MPLLRSYRQDERNKKQERRAREGEGVNGFEGEEGARGGVSDGWMGFLIDSVFSAYCL